MRVYSKLIALPFLAVLRFAQPGIDDMSINYRLTGGTQEYEVKVTARQQPAGGIGDTYYSERTRYKEGVKARVLAMRDQVLAMPIVRTLKLSDAGVPNDANTNVDYTATIQALYDQAITAGGMVQIIWDVDTRTKGIKYHGLTRTTFVGNPTLNQFPGGGDLYNNGVMPHFYNANPTFIPGQAVDKYIIFEGQALLDGYGQRASSPRIGWMGPFRAYGTESLVVMDWTFTRAASFNYHIINTKKTYLYNVEVTGGGLNSDGDHLNGFNEDYYIHGHRFTCQDDHHPRNAADALDADINRYIYNSDGSVTLDTSGYNYYQDLHDPANTGMRGIVTEDGLWGKDGPGAKGFRVLRGGAAFCDEIYFGNISGYTTEYVHTQADFGEDTPGRLQPAGQLPASNVMFENIDIYCTNGGGGAEWGISSDTAGFGAYNVMRRNYHENNGPTAVFSGSQAYNNRVPAHTFIIWNGYCRQDLSAQQGTPFTNPDMVIYNCTISDRIEFRNATMLHPGGPSNVLGLELRSMNIPKVDMTGCRLDGFNNLLRLNSTDVGGIVLDNVNHVNAAAGSTTVFSAGGGALGPISSTNYQGPGIHN